MDIIKIVGIGISSLFIAIILKQYRPEYWIYISIIAGILIFMLSIDKLQEIINMLTSIVNKASINTSFIFILLKITGISILAEYAISLCKDAGEVAIANKVDLGSKIIIISMSIPIINSILESILKILP